MSRVPIVAAIPRRPARAWAITLATVGVAFATGCADGTTSHGLVGEAAPAYAAVTLTGDSVRLADLRGQPVLLNVWATWCPPCREEIPVLQALHEELAAEGLRVVGVSVDNAAADEAVVAFRRNFGMTYAVWRDPAQRVSSAFRTRGVPVTLLVDAEGIVRWRHLGPITADDPALQAALESTLEADAGISTESGT